MDIKKRIEVKMISEFPFREMCRRLFSVDTGDDNFWKKIICDIMYREIGRLLSGVEYPVSDLEEEILESQRKCVERYQKKFSSFEPRFIDFPRIQSEYEKLMSDNIFEKPGINFPEDFKIKYCRGGCEMRLLNLSPLHHGDVDEFFDMIEKKGGFEEYRKEVEVLYFLIKKFQ